MIKSIFPINHKYCKILLYILLVISLFGNIVYFVSDGLYEIYILKTKFIENKPSDKKLSLEDFESELRRTSLKMIEGNQISPRPLPYKHSSLQSNFKFNCKGYDSHTSLFYWGGGWMLYCVLESAEQNGDSVAILKAKDIFDSKVLNEPIHEVDQSLWGICSIIFYEKSKDIRYKKYAENMYRWLKESETLMGIPYRNTENDINLVDGLGMYNPFLIYYANVFDDSTAYKMAVRQAEYFIEYAVNDKFGTCSHGYRMQPPQVKIGSANWGRGNSWYALGLCDINEEDLSGTSKIKIQKFGETMKMLYESDGQFSAFIGQQGKEDISVSIPILYYLVKKGLIDKHNIKVIEYSKYMHDGVMYNGSGECGGVNKYSDYTGSSPFIQAMMLRLVTLCNKE